MELRRVYSLDLLRACRSALSANCTGNVLVLGDVYQPLFSVSEVYAAFQDGKIAGVCSIYRAFPTPSVIFSEGAIEVREALVEKAVDSVQGAFISLCPPDDVDLFEGLATVAERRHEQQMTTRTARIHAQCDVKSLKVRRADLEQLEEFYAKHGAAAWAPIQFEAGPFYCVKQKGEIVSAAGVHLVTPRVAQLGNIITNEACRNRGFATACISALTADLSSKGRIISLFVRTDNVSAIHVYEKLGFTKRRDVEFLIMQKRT